MEFFVAAWAPPTTRMLKQPARAGAGLGRQPPARLHVFCRRPRSGRVRLFKEGVVEPCRYEPGLQRTYEELIHHYGAVILPARPGAATTKPKSRRGFWSPKDGPSPDGTRPFFSLEALNARIAELVHHLNHRKIMRLPGDPLGAV